MAYYDSDFIKDKPYIGQSVSYNGFDELIEKYKLLTETHMKQLGLKLKPNEEPIAFQYVNITGRRGYIGLYDRTEEIKKINIFEEENLLLHYLRPSAYRGIGISIKRKSMPIVGYVYSYESGYTKVCDVSQEEEWKGVTEKVENFLEALKKEDITVEKEHNGAIHITYKHRGAFYNFDVRKNNTGEYTIQNIKRYYSGMDEKDTVNPNLLRSAQYKKRMLEALGENNKMRLVLLF